MNSNDSIVLSWSDIQQDTLLLAEKLRNHQWDRIYAVSRGGMIPAALIAYDLEIRHIDTICVKSYDSRKQGEFELIKSPVQEDMHNILIVDDISDSGKTAELIKKFYPETSYAALYVKRAGKDDVDYYIREYPEEKWIAFPWEK